MGCGSSKVASPPQQPPRPRSPSPELDPDYSPAYYFSSPNNEAAQIQSRVLASIIGTRPKTPPENVAAEASNAAGPISDVGNRERRTSHANVAEAKSDAKEVSDEQADLIGGSAVYATQESHANEYRDYSTPPGDLSFALGTLLGTNSRAHQPGQGSKALREMEYHTAQKGTGLNASKFESELAPVEVTKMIPGPREINPGKNLCIICETADLKQQWATKNGDEWEPPAIDLGFVGGILLTDGCALCRLVSASLRQSWTSVPEQTVDGYRIRCFIPNVYPPSGKPARRFWELSISLSTRNGRLPPNCRQKFPTVVRLDHRHTRGLGIRDGVMQLAKAIDSEQCDREYIQSLFRRCRTSHCSATNKLRTEITCDRPRGYIPPEELVDDPSETDPTIFRVIDVANKCIVEAARESSFVALSYVWGRAPFLRLLKENFELLSAPNGLDAYEIPKTITDAMETTQLMGEKYLWVDALCIIQDDPIDIAAQIGRMDQVYSSAACTIVAAAGLDAHAGLAGIHRSLRYAPQHSETISDMLFHTMGPTLEQSLHESTWWSRGWTYQEFCLSRRLLIFTSSRVFFSCASEHDSEDVVHEDRAAKNAFLASGGPFQGSRSDFSGDLRTRLQSRAFDLDDSVKTYKILVRDYSARNLSYDSDVLNGVQGILRLLTLRSKRSFFVAGMPEHRLDTALLWFPVGPLTRRGPANSGHPYPSWSWAGWKGGVAYEEHDFVSVMTQEVTEWQLETPEGQTIELLVDQIPFSKLLNNKRPAAEAARREKQRKDLYTLYESGVLRFATQTAEFMVDLAPASARGYWPGHPNAKVFPILAGAGTSQLAVAGSILLSLEDAAALRNDPSFSARPGEGKVAATFILISSTQKPWYFTSTGGDSVEPYDEDVYDFLGGSVLDIEVKRFVCNVLWVKEVRQGLFERVAVGQIHIHAWEQSQSGKIDVRLA